MYVQQNMQVVVVHTMERPDGMTQHWKTLTPAHGWSCWYPTDNTEQLRVCSPTHIHHPHQYSSGKYFAGKSNEQGNLAKIMLSILYFD